MATLDITGSDWVAVTLTADEIWQAREATILTTVEAIARSDQGIELIPGAVRMFKNGQTVRYKAKLISQPMPILVREEI